MNCKKKYCLIIFLTFTFLVLFKINTHATCSNFINKAKITENDSSFVLEIIPNRDFRNGEYMKIALHYGPGDEKIIFEGKIKRDENDYHYIVRFKTQLEKYVYHIIAVTTGKKKRTTAYLGINVTQGDYRELLIYKYPTVNNILLMVSDKPGNFN